MGDVSEEALLDFIFTAGGKVKNSDLLKTYKHFINHNDKQLRAKYREEFKNIIDKIAMVKSEEGEKYLVLKKKYKQLMLGQEAARTSSRERPRCGPSRPSKSGVDEVSSATNRVPDLEDPGTATDRAAGRMSPGGVPWCGELAITITEAPMSEVVDEEQHVVKPSSQPGPGQSLFLQAGESQTRALSEDELDKDPGSKSESELEQEDEGTGSVGSPALALDPLEKEWMQSAACGRLAHLTELLHQDPTLATKKDFTSGFTALHWAAKHGMEDMATLMANSGADVNTKAHGGYTPLHIAALHGHHHIMNLLVRTYGAKETVRDYSGHLACHYLSTQDPEGENNEAGLQVTSAGERRCRRLVTLFQQKKKWGSAEDLPTVAEERPATQQLALPPFRPRKFSR